jgi:hypothetical protein
VQHAVAILVDQDCARRHERLAGVEVVHGTWEEAKHVARHIAAIVQILPPSTEQDRRLPFTDTAEQQAGIFNPLDLLPDRPIGDPVRESKLAEIQELTLCLGRLPSAPTAQSILDYLMLVHQDASYQTGSTKAGYDGEFGTRCKPDYGFAKPNHGP